MYQLEQRLYSYCLNLLMAFESFVQHRVKHWTNKAVTQGERPIEVLHGLHPTKRIITMKQLTTNNSKWSLSTKGLLHSILKAL